MIVMKFGGSSLADSRVLDAALEQIRKTARNERTVVVVSAVGRTTDHLIASELDPAAAVEAVRAAHEHILARLDTSSRRALVRTIDALADRASWRDRAELHAHGERIASAAVAELLRESGTGALDLGLEHVMIAEGVPVTVDIPATRDRLGPAMAVAGDAVLVLGGFAGQDGSNRLRLLGRGGSDTIATSVGAALGARIIELWKDVDGIHNDDPRGCSDSSPRATLHWREADALARSGARILHAQSVAPAWDARIPIHVRHTGYPHEAGTWICDEGAAVVQERRIA